MLARLDHVAGVITNIAVLKFSNKLAFWLSKRLVEVGITIRNNGSILSFSSNPTKKVSSK